MLSATRGTLTGAIINAMRVAFGVGAWFVPILIGAWGVWLALREVSDQQLLTPRRLIAATVLFVIFEAAIELLVGGDEPLAGQGGGALGFMVSQGLVLVLGEPVTVVVLILAAIGRFWRSSECRFIRSWKACVTAGAACAAPRPAPKARSPIHPCRWEKPRRRCGAGGAA